MSNHTKHVEITEAEVGKRYARLTVIALGHEKHGRTAALCRCDCGQELVATFNTLRRGNTRSCGCFKNELIGKRQRTHGRSRTPEYRSWCAMKDRCGNPNNQDFHHYGGRGITVCPQWEFSFETFLADMGPITDGRNTIERIDTNGNYEPGNCRWATQKEQTRNKRTNRLITVNGETHPVGVWAERFNIDQRLICERLNRGWPPEEAMAPPLQRRWSTRKGERLVPAAAS